MTVVHRMTGYDKRTERLEIEHDIPAERFSDVRALAHVPIEDEDAAGSYPLDASAARQLGWTLDKPVNLDLYDWFVEPFAVGG